MAYPLLAPTARLERLDPLTKQYYLKRSNSLDGLTYLQVCRPPNCEYDTSGDYAAIRWLNAHIQGDPVIVEASGAEYSSYGRVSAFTGLPTVMGWAGHEYQWRVNWLKSGDITTDLEHRLSDIDTIYKNPSSNVVLSTMARYHAQYIYVGSLEFKKYPGVDLHRFSAFMETTYSADGVTIYKVP